MPAAEIFTKLEFLIKNNQHQQLEEFLSSAGVKEFDINFIQVTDNSESSGDKIERDTFDVKKQSLLHVAIASENINAVTLLLKHKANVNLKFVTKTGEMTTQYGGFTGAERTVISNTVKEQLLTPVELACSLDNIAMASLLVLGGGVFEVSKINEKYRESLLALQEQFSKIYNENIQLKKEKEVVSSQSETYKKILSSDEKFVNHVVDLQTAFRVIQAKRLFKKNNQVRQEKVKYIEELAAEVIALLAKKKRFADVERISNHVQTSPPLEVKEELLKLKAELSEQPSKDHRLLVGEGNFSFARAVTEKKRKRETKTEIKTETVFVASDIESFEQLHKKYKTEFDENKKVLEQNPSVLLLEKVDATQINQDPQLKPISPRYKKIYFNCPHNGKSYDTGTLPPMMSEFYKSAHSLQQPGDEVHMILPKEENVEKQQWRYTKYGIYQAAAEAGYVYKEKYKDIAKRYPGYVHTETKKAGTTFSAEKLREHVFIRTDYQKTSINWQVPREQHKGVAVFSEQDSLPMDNTSQSSVATPSGKTNKFG